MGLKERLRGKVGGRVPRRMRSEVAVTRAEAAAIAREEAGRGAHPSEPFDDDQRGHKSVTRAMHAATIDPPNDATLRPLTAPEETAAFASAGTDGMEAFVTGGGEASGSMADFVTGADNESTTDAVVETLFGGDADSDDWLEVDLL
jgi:hypothetical protein